MNEIVPGQNPNGPEENVGPEEIKDFVKNITLRRGEFQAEISNLPHSIVEALYHEITGKKEELDYELFGSKKYDYASINDIITRINQNCQKYNLVKCDTSVRFKLSDGRKYNFSSWHKFSEFDFRTNAKTAEITVIVSFVIKTNIGTFNSYTISLDLISWLGTPVHINDKQLESIYNNLSEDARSGRLKIEYVDSLVARDFYDVIREWFAQLANAPLTHNYPFLRKNLNNGWFLVIVLQTLFPIIPAYGAYQIILLNQSPENIAKAVFLAICVTSVTMAGVRFFWNKFIYMFSSVHNFSVLTITDGDRDAINNKKNSNKKRVIVALIYSFGMLLSLIVNIFSNYIYDLFKH